MQFRSRVIGRYEIFTWAVSYKTSVQTPEPAGGVGPLHLGHHLREQLQPHRDRARRLERGLSPGRGDLRQGEQSRHSHQLIIINQTRVFQWCLDWFKEIRS